MPAACGAAILSALPGCTFDTLDYTNKACGAESPCPSGWECALGACRTPPDSCAVHTAGFGVGWTTPNAIRWTWDLVGDAAALEPHFTKYQLRFGPGILEKANPDDPDAALDSNDVQELLKLTIPYDPSRTLLRSVITDVHDGQPLEAGSTYWAQLRAIDDTGCVSRSPTVEATTAPDPNGSIAIFEDDATVLDNKVADSTPPACSVPLSAVSDGKSYAGSQTHLATTITAPSGLECLSYWNIHLGWSAPKPLSKTATSFSGAFVEYAFSRDDGQPAWFSLHLIGKEGMTKKSWGFEGGFGIRSDGEWQLVQIPLDALHDKTDPLEASDEVTSMLMGGVWPQKSLVRIDHVSIRY